MATRKRKKKRERERTRKEDGASAFERLGERQWQIKNGVMSERERGTIEEDALIQRFQQSSLLPCLNLPVVVKSWKCNAATTNKSSSLTGI